LELVAIFGGAKHHHSKGVRENKKDEFRGRCTKVI